MAVVRIRRAPPGPGIGAEAHAAVEAVTDYHDNPPEGLIVHTLGQADGGEWLSISVWESAEAADRYDNQAIPKIQQVHGPDFQVPAHTTYEAHCIVRG